MHYMIDSTKQVALTLLVALGVVSPLALAQQSQDPFQAAKDAYNKAKQEFQSLRTQPKPNQATEAQAEGSVGLEQQSPLQIFKDALKTTLPPTAGGRQPHRLQTRRRPGRERHARRAHWLRGIATARAQHEIDASKQSKPNL